MQQLNNNIMAKSASPHASARVKGTRNPYAIQDGAHLDISMNGFWGGHFEKCYTDIRVFNPLAPSNSRSSLQSTYRKHESLKKRAYKSHLRKVEHSSFTPLAFYASGEMGHKATVFIRD